MLNSQNFGLNNKCDTTILCNLDMNWTVGDCNVSRIPDCPMSAALRLHAGGSPPGRPVSVCPRPARPQLSWLKTTTTNSPRPARPPADCKFYCHFAENPSGFAGTIRLSFEDDMGNVLVLLNHLFFQFHIVSPDAPRLCELSGWGCAVSAPAAGPAPGHWGWNSHVGVLGRAASTATPSRRAAAHSQADAQNRAQCLPMFCDTAHRDPGDWQGDTS